MRCLRPGWRSMAVVLCNGLRTAGSFQCQSSPCGSEGLFRVRVEQPVERYDAMTQMTQGKGSCSHLDDGRAITE